MYNDIYNKDQYAYQYGIIRKWLRYKIDGFDLSLPLKERSIHRIAVYGVAGLGGLLFEELKDTDISIKFFLDQKYEIYKNGAGGVPVYGLDHMPSMEKVDAVIVTPVFYFAEILNELATRGVPLEKIISLGMIIP